MYLLRKVGCFLFSRQVFREFSLLVGLRHILDVEDHDWLLRDEVQRGLKVVEEENLVFDCLVRPHILKHVATLGTKYKIEDS